ncbi:hypothetical protein [Streptomyces carpinensis]|uniref:Uncharacterized protein n=1 Tax=Streptomyces carpinensis TaxID=66369 RepID=A0ABV1W553_9ACTN|nr:hypothetical protein [Streptomyces carpinensis]
MLEMPAPVVMEALGYHRAARPSWPPRPEAPGADAPLDHHQAVREAADKEHGSLDSLKRANRQANQWPLTPDEARLNKDKF